MDSQEQPRTRQQRRADLRKHPRRVEDLTRDQQRIVMEMVENRVAIRQAAILLDRALFFMDGGKDPDHLPAETRELIRQFLQRHPVGV